MTIAQHFRFLPTVGMTGIRGHDSYSVVLATRILPTPVSPRRGRDRREWALLRHVHGAEAVLGEEEKYQGDADCPDDGGGKVHHAVL